MADGPGGLSAASFKSVSLEVGDWLLGTVQGAFNEKATISQIIVDADVSESFASGRDKRFNGFWGLNVVPNTAEEWRYGSAVLDEWNGNGFIVVGTVLPGHSMPGASASKCAEHQS